MYVHTEVHEAYGCLLASMKVALTVQVIDILFDLFLCAYQNSLRGYYEASMAQTKRHGRPRGSMARWERALELAKDAHCMFRKAAAVPEGRTDHYTFDGADEVCTPAQ